MTERGEYLKAVEDFHQADSIEKKAAALRKSARQIILDWYEEHPEDFDRAKDGEKTFIGRVGAPPGDGHGVSITFPVKKGLPARFDDSRVNEAHDYAQEIDTRIASELFIQTYEFVGPERVIDFCHRFPGYATKVASLLIPFTLPAIDDEQGSPRVAPIKRK